MAKIIITVIIDDDGEHNIDWSPTEFDAFEVADLLQDAADDVEAYAIEEAGVNIKDVS